MICEYCGHAHPIESICTKRPKWSRRGFIALLGAAAVGAATGMVHGGLPIGHDAEISFKELNRITMDEVGPTMFPLRYYSVSIPLEQYEYERYLGLFA